MTLERVRVGDVLRLVRSPVIVDPERVYTSIGIRSFGKGIFKYEPKPGSELGRLRFFEVEPGRLLFSNIKGWEGAIAVSGDDHRDCVASNRFLPYEAFDDRIDVDWAKWFFLSEPGLELIGRASPGSADRNRTLAIDRFEALEIPLPPIGEQRRVASAIEYLVGQQREIAALSGTAFNLSSALIGSLTQSVDTAVRLGELVAQVKREVRPVADVEYKLLGARWYGEGLFIRERKLGAESSASTLYRVQADDFVYNRLFAWKGSFAVAGPEVDGCYVSNEFPTFRVDETRLDVRYLHALFRNPDLWSLVEAKSTGGTPTSRNRFKEAELCELAVPLPPLNIQLAIVLRINTILRASELRAEVAAHAEALVAAAINKAFLYALA